MRDIFKLTRNAAVALGVAFAASAGATTAVAAPILSFGQIGNGTPITGTRTGNSTTLRATNAAIDITQIASGPLASASLTFTFASSSAAILFNGNITQNFSGNFCITSLANCSGTNYLSGSLIDVAFGSGVAFNLSASTPPSGNVLFTSGVIPVAQLQLDRGASLSFASVNPSLRIQANTIDSFVSSISGTFSANNEPTRVPEPLSLSLLGLGLVGMGLARRRRA